MKHSVLLSLVLAASPLAAAESLQCEDPLIRVEAADRRTAERTCNSAAAARESLRACGIVIDRPLEIAVTDTVVGELGPCAGLFHCGEDRIEIHSPEAMPAIRQSGGAFEGVSDEAFWDSVLVHEMTHAAYDTVYCPFPSCVATSEYAGFAMQVLSLPPEERVHFGTSVELRERPGRSAISAIMYFMAPDKFAKIAWLHFNARPDPCAYLGLVMTGEIFFDRAPH